MEAHCGDLPVAKRRRQLELPVPRLRGPHGGARDAESVGFLAATGEQGNGDEPSMDVDAPLRPVARPPLSLAPVSYGDVFRAHSEHLVLVSVAFGLLAMVLTSEDSWARGWVLIGVLSYILGKSWSSLDHLGSLLVGQRYVQAHVHYQQCPGVFNAITEQLAASVIQGRSGEKVMPRDCYCFLETDYTTGQKKINFSFWGQHPRRQTVNFVDSSGNLHAVAIDYKRGGDVLTGRDKAIHAAVAPPEHAVCRT